MREGLLDGKTLLVALREPPFMLTIGPRSLQELVAHGMPYHRMPGRKRRYYLLAEVIPWLREYTLVQAS